MATDRIVINIDNDDRFVIKYDDMPILIPDDHCKDSCSSHNKCVTLQTVECKKDDYIEKTSSSEPMEKMVEEFEQCVVDLMLRSNEDCTTEVEKYQCLLCMENEKKCIFYPCNHRCLCIGCAIKMASAALERYGQNKNNSDSLIFRCIYCNMNSSAIYEIRET